MQRPFAKSQRQVRAMKVPTPEVLLALRAPNAGWLAALICALDEAQHDPNFSETQRALVHRLLDADSLQMPIVAAAQERLARFEEDLRADFAMLEADLAPEPPAPTERRRPKLTLCVANA